MKQIKNIVLLLGIIFSMSSRINYAQNLTAMDIMKKNVEQQKEKDESIELTMNLINKKGDERTRKIIQYKKLDADGEQMSLIRFEYPADVKGTGLLTLEHSDSDDDQWLYLPALRKERRISSSDKSDKFVGTDFTYQDLKDEEVENYDYKLISDEKVDGRDCYKIEALPNNDKEKKESKYSKRILWIDKSNYIAVQVHYFDKSKQLYKTMKSGDIRLVDGTSKWRSHKIEMSDLKSDHKTVLLFDQIEINKGINNSVFTVRYLKR